MPPANALSLTEDREELAARATAKDAIEDVQLRGVTRWSPRRAGLPPLVDWWPAYALLALAAILVLLITIRLLIDSLAPFAHVLVVAGVATVLTFALAPLVGRLERRMPRPAAAALVFFGTLLAVLAAAGFVVLQIAVEGAKVGVAGSKRATGSFGRSTCAASAQAACVGASLDPQCAEGRCACHARRGPQ